MAGVVDLLGQADTACSASCFAADAEIETKHREFAQGESGCGLDKVAGNLVAIPAQAVQHDDHRQRLVPIYEQLLRWQMQARGQHRIAQSDLETLSPKGTRSKQSKR